MVFNDTAGGQGICQEIDSACDSDVLSHTLEVKTRRANVALQQLELIALQASGAWEFDDSNYSTLPTGLQSLSNGTAEYAFDSTLLEVQRVEVLLADGTTWNKLKPLDERMIPGSLTDYLEIPGVPFEYYKRGKFIGLTPVPETGKVTMTNGLKVYFTRTGSLFTTSDTTKEPGIASPFHILIAKKVAIEFCKTYKKDRVPQLAIDIAVGEKALKEFYSSRRKDEAPRMTMRRIKPR